jgi:hypothetical protein
MCIGERLQFKYLGEREIINSQRGDTEKITKRCTVDTEKFECWKIQKFYNLY